MYKMGEEILVRDSGGVWKSRHFKFSDGDIVWCKSISCSELLVSWPQHKPKYTTKEYTLETFPRGLTWVRENDGVEVSLVMVVVSYGVIVNHKPYTFSKLLEGCKISTDNCQTWHKAGVQTDGNTSG